MSVECNACYAASTQPAWLAQLVVNARTDRPCPGHSGAGDATYSILGHRDPRPDLVRRLTREDPR